MTFFHHGKSGQELRAAQNGFESPKKICKHTVDGDGNALVESVAISTNEGWDFAELVKLQVFSRNTLGRLGLNDLEVDVVCLCDCADGN